MFEHPHAKKYNKEGEKLWCELNLIFGDCSSSDYNKSLLNSINRTSEKHIVNSDSDDDDDLDGGVCDKGSVVGI